MSAVYYIRIHNIIIIKFNFATQNFYITGIWRTTVRTSDDVILFLKSNRICVFFRERIIVRRRGSNKKQRRRKPGKCAFPIPGRWCRRSASDPEQLNTDTAIPCFWYTGVNSDFPWKTQRDLFHWVGWRVGRGRGWSWRKDEKTRSRSIVILLSRKSIPTRMYLFGTYPFL